MISKTRSFRDLRNPIRVLILLAAFVAAGGCSTSNTTGGVVVNHVNASGNSVPGWVTPSGGLHANSATMNYIANGGSSSCTECHGSDLAGGISRVSCFNAACHHDPIAGWVATSPTAQEHGVSAKKAPGSSGFASCQICHGNNFSGGGAQVSCTNNPNAACHGPAVASPHPPDWLLGDTYVHSNTDPANAPVCYQCHAYTGTANPNNPHVPPTPAPGGTAPGCFNGTMCHNQAGHPAGWAATSPAAQPHGDSAKATPGATAGYTYCQTCHGTGTNFSGGSSGVSCYTCHVPTANSPHASQWRTGDTYVHTTTATGNASACAFCHLNGANSPIAAPSPPAPGGTSPGCFNSTLCHGSGGVAHSVPYNDDSHYTVTSATFPGSCSACHDVSAPSAGPACQTCHVAASPLAAANCTSCHASAPNSGAPAGAAYPNIAGAHAAHIALDSAGSPVSCDTCHTGLGPSLLNLNHYNRAKSLVPPGDVAFPATYNAQSGASSFDNGAALSCSSVSCHGGQATPNWRTGALNVNTQCTSCHAIGAAQFNGPTSSNHSRSDHQVVCTICHNTTALAANHFTNLSTTTMEGPASATIGGAGTAITSWNPTTKSCDPACHGSETW
ncbi:MAG: CxxxxCH/CxxCH domain-containing protein [Deltaproteobacteria bacterium]|nr:CxxxxCH/CxxCH domain-containing protein [Deltaproteobacteria bacterium]